MTVNPALFSEVIVPGCAFKEVTDAIVVSGEEKTVDKGELCRRPLIFTTIFFERTLQMSEVSVGRQSQRP